MWVLSSPPVPYGFPATDLRQVNAICFVGPDILDEEINGPSPLAIFSRINQLVSFNPPHRSLYRITCTVEAIGVERLHCRFNAKRSAAMDHFWSHKVAVPHTVD